MRQWLREYRLLVQTANGSETFIDLSRFRIVFDISQALLNKPCTAEITVYNVGRETANQVQIPTNSVADYSKRLKVILEAGYQGNSQTIFKGELWWKTIGRESETDTFMRLVASSGDTAWNYGVISQSLPAGATQADIFKAQKASLKGYGVETMEDPALQTGVLPRGKVIFKPLRDSLNELATTNNFTYALGSDGLVAAPSDDHCSKESMQTAIELTAATGLVGRPELTMDGLTCTCLLNPMIDVGTVIRINNASIQRDSYDTSIGAINENGPADDSMVDGDGYYIVKGRHHYGDTHGDDWYTDIIAVGVRADVETYGTAILQMGSNE